MSYWYIFVGSLFLFNPSINLIDFLPDFIGIILILIGMRKIADLNNYIGDAFIKMRWSLWVAFGKLVCLLLVRSLDATMILVFSFATAILECAFLIPAFIGLLEGMEYLSIREIDNGLYDTSKLKMTTLVFIVVRAVGSFLPGVAAMLISTSTGAVNSGTGISADAMNFYLNLLFASIVMAIGIVWVVGVFKLIKAYASSEELNKVLIQRYQHEILDNKEIMIRRRIRMMTLLAFLATLPLITVKIDYHYVMPELAFGILYMASTYVCGKYTNDKKLRVMSIVSSIICLIQFVILWIFEDLFGEYTFDSFEIAFKNDYYPELFISIVALALISYAIMYVCHLLMSKLFCKAIDESVGLKGEYTDLRRFDLDNEKKKLMKKRVVMTNIIMGVYCLVSFITTITSQLYDLRETWLLRLTFGLVLMVTTYFVNKQISDEAENAL